MLYPFNTHHVFGLDGSDSSGFTKQPPKIPKVLRLKTKSDRK